MRRRREGAYHHLSRLYGYGLCCEDVAGFDVVRIVPPRDREEDVDDG